MPELGAKRPPRRAIRRRAPGAVVFAFTRLFRPLSRSLSLSLALIYLFRLGKLLSVAAALWASPTGAPFVAESVGIHVILQTSFYAQSAPAWAAVEFIFKNNAFSPLAADTLELRQCHRGTSPGRRYSTSSTASRTALVLFNLYGSQEPGSSRCNRPGDFELPRNFRGSWWKVAHALPAGSAGTTVAAICSKRRASPEASAQDGGARQSTPGAAACSS